jgi:hypothetical protein
VLLLPIGPPGSLDALGPLLDDALGRPSPRDTIGVVGRADEVGEGGRDAPARAARLAAELRGRRPHLLACATVLPVSGALAQAADEIDAADVAALAALLAEPPEQLATALVSVDGFCHPVPSAVTVERRHALVSRLGLSGIRLVLQELHASPGATVEVLGARLRAASNVDRLRAEIEQRFAARRDELKAATALRRLRDLVRPLADQGDGDAVGAAARRVTATLDGLERTDPALAARRALRLVTAGAVRLSESEVREVAAVLVGTSVSERLDRPPDTDPDELRRLIASARRRWEVLASSPANDGALGDVCAAVLGRYDADAAELGVT